MRVIVFLVGLGGLLVSSTAIAQTVTASPGATAGRQVTYGEIQNMRSLGVKIRLLNCRDSCQKELIDASVTPEIFMLADTVDFVGERLLRVPEFVYGMKNLKAITLRKSSLTEDELINLAKSSKLEILDLENVTIKLSATKPEDGNDSKGGKKLSADFMRKLTGMMPNLRSLNLGSVGFKIQDNSFYEVEEVDFLDREVADRLTYLKVGLSSGSLYYYPFLSLETLSGGNSAKFAPEYQDAFALPSLRVLEGFSNADFLIRERVKKRQTPPAVSRPNGGDK